MYDDQKLPYNIDKTNFHEKKYKKKFRFLDDCEEIINDFILLFSLNSVH